MIAKNKMIKTGNQGISAKKTFSATERFIGYYKGRERYLKTK